MHNENSWQLKGYTLDDAPYNYYPDLKLEPKHMRLELDIDLAEQTVKGTNTLTVQSNSDDAREIILDAVDFHSVDVTTSGLEWTYDDSRIRIALDQPLAKGESVDLVVAYEVRQPQEGLYFSYPDGAYPDRPVYAGSDHESERARYWIPAIDHPSIRTTYEYIITSEEHYTILAIGRLLSETVADGKKTVHWRHDYPCPTYITAVALGELTEYVDTPTDAGNGEIPVAYYTSSDYDPAHLKLAFDRTPKMIRWFLDKFQLPFAWDKYYQFSFLRIFGAMENQSLVSWSDYAMLNEGTSLEFAHNIDDTNVHEMAHTYFGDMVVIKNWSHAWLKESWATYCSSLYFEDNSSADHFAYDLYVNASSYFGEVSKYVRPIVNNKYHSSWEMFDSHLYPGGAWRLHMLRNLLGDDVFFTAVRDYLRTYAGRTVETVDFQRKLEEHSGMSLGQFFDQWILQPKGHPHLEVSFSHSDGKGQFTVTQKQITDDGNDVRNRPFIMDIDLAWSVDGELHTRKVTLDQKVHQFSVQMDSPDYVTLDPRHKVLFKRSTKFKDSMYRGMLGSADLFTQLDAVSMLTDSGKRKNIDAVADFYFSTDFWGYKIQVLNALGSANSRFAIPHLVRIMEEETDPVALRFVAGNATKYRDDAIEEALLSFSRRDLNPFAKAAAIQALGKQSERVHDEIRMHLGSDGWKHMTRAAAFIALATTRDPRYVDLLVEAVGYGNQPERIRRQLISALASLGKWQVKSVKQRIIDTLEQMLREEQWEVRSAVFHALIALNARGSVSKMERIYGLHAHQTVVSFKKALKEMKSPDDTSKLSDLVDRVEKLEEKLQKIDEKLQKSED